MFNIKGTLLFLLPAAFMLLSIACGDSQPSPTATIAPTPTQVPPTATPTPSSTSTPKQTPVPSPTPEPTSATTTASSLEVSSEQINWITVTDRDKIYSISVPSEWETNSDISELAEQSPQFGKSGMVLFLQSYPETGGSGLLVYADIKQLLFEEPKPIDLETYIQLQVEDLNRSFDPDNPEVSGRVLSGPIETHVISINGIGETQIRYTVSMTMYEGTPQVNFLVNTLIGDEDDPVTGCGSIVYMVQGSYLVADTVTESSVIEKALESFRVLPTASGVDSCSDRKGLSLLD